MQKAPTTRRKAGDKRDGSHIKPKFQQEREESVKVNPVKPLNQKQAEYIRLLKERSIVVATGFAGSSKTYLPTALAADAFKTGVINKIIITRPAISSSRSVGFFSGSVLDKMSVWLGSVMPILIERLGHGALEIAIANKDIEFIPLEVVKGMSINDAFMLCEESSDLTKEEVIKLVTRVGRNSTLVLAGDIRQSELKGDSGLSWLTSFIARHQMQDSIGLVDFNDVNDIVRSEIVKKFITNLVRDERKGIN